MKISFKIVLKIFGETDFSILVLVLVKQEFCLNCVLFFFFNGLVLVMMA